LEHTSIGSKIIYLDQFVISNIAKVISPDFQREIDHHEYWVVLYKIFIRLTKKGLIIVPYSNIHQNESLFSRDKESLIRLYEVLGNGVSFRSIDYIQRMQIIEHCRNWMKGIKSDISIDINKVLNGRIDSIPDRFIVTSHISNNQFWMDALSRTRDSGKLSLIEVFKKWISSGQEEVTSYSVCKPAR